MPDAGAMREPERSGLIRPTDQASLDLAKRLIRGARFGSISVLEPATGDPFASRVLTGTDIDGVPVILISRLAVHTQALLADPRCALLLGEPGKGDPLAWPRITLKCRAEQVVPGSESDTCTRNRFLRRHPKAKLYAAFQDFSFYRLVPISANMNGGFGRAYIFSGSELIIRSALNDYLSACELQIREQVEGLGCNVANQIARDYFHEKTGNWYISGLDAEGLEVAYKSKLHRLQSIGCAETVNGLIAEFSNILNCQSEN